MAQLRRVLRVSASVVAGASGGDSSDGDMRISYFPARNARVPRAREESRTVPSPRRLTEVIPNSASPRPRSNFRRGSAEFGCSVTRSTNSLPRPPSIPESDQWGGNSGPQARKAGSSVHRSESGPCRYRSTGTRRRIVLSPKPMPRETLCRSPTGLECTGRSRGQDQWHWLAQLNTRAQLQSETDGPATAFRNLPYGRYSNFSITTSFSFCRGFSLLATTKNAR